MSEHATTTSLENPEVRHAGPDIKFGVVLAVVLVFLAVMVAIHFVLAALWGGFAARDSRPSTASPAQMTAMPPTPRLQAAPAEDEKYLRRRQWERLHSYGWVDRKTGVVHIPLERAMELEAKR